MLTLVDRVARAHKEGGFLGIGGKQISDSEQQALDEIAAALRLDAPARSILIPSGLQEGGSV